MWQRYRSLFFLALSYCWLSREHPDPRMYHLARVARVVWGVRDPKFGGCVSLGAVLSDPRLNHTAEVVEGVCAEEARALLQEFFRSKR